MANIANMTPQQFSLRWNNYTTYIAGAFDSLRYEEDFVDVTLCCEGRKIRAHKILLSACSPYFKEVFKENPCQHPVIIFKNVRYTDLMSLVEFMYQGEVSVAQDQLPSFLHTAELLSIRGLTDSATEARPPGPSTSTIAQQLIQSQPVLEKAATITAAESVFLTLPSNSTIVHQPKLVQTQLQATPIMSKTIIKTAPSEMPALTTPSATITVPIAQQQPTLTKIQMQAPQQQATTQSQSAQQQQHHVQVQVQQVQQVQPQQQTQQQTQQQAQLLTQSQQAPQATTLQEVVDNVVQPRKKKIKVQQILASQASTSIPATTTVTVTASGSGHSTDGEIFSKFETETYTITDAKDDSRTDQEQVETYTESGQNSSGGMKMEIPEFISLGEPISASGGGNNAFIQEGYELVSEDKDEDDEEMGQDNIEIEAADMDMSRIFQETTDEQTKSNILKDTELRFRCSICWKGFKHPMSLTLHKDLHSGKTKCPVCLRSFSRSYDMRIHLNKIHQVTLKLDARFNFKNTKSD
uniref:BTB domain-containing protein n=1 Tax=Anopheles atroparvus TaxID=41427 RepID=A0AAG5DV94_ANOAO